MNLNRVIASPETCMQRSLLTMVATILLVACAAERASAPAIDGLDEATFRRHLVALSADEFAGRKPATPGEEKTVEYIRQQFAAVGLKPGNGSTYFQSVPLVEITADPKTTLTVSSGSESRSFKYRDDMVVWTKRVVADSALEQSELVFVGYGIVAPEYDWNDYASANIKGKTAVILINDPGFVTQDPKLFAGRAMTYHGRWTYKYEEAMRQGAAGALIIHDTEPAAYGWEVVQSGWTGPQLDMASSDGNAGRVAIEGWISGPTAEAIFQLAGKDLTALEAAAVRRDFKAVPLNLRASVAVHNSIRRSNSSNVVGILPGRKRPDEYMLYMAHWDHLGRSDAVTGDNIYNGAIDNGTGTAALITLAQAFARAKPAPQRSVVFVAVTAEESGLLGSAHYADHPLFPLERTAAVINMDALYAGGPTRDVAVIGYGSSELEDYLRDAAEKQDRVLKPEPTPERGFFYRSDHFNLAKKGVPALYFKLGTDDREHGDAWGRQQQEDFVAQRYHKPSDQYDPSLDFRGSMQDIELFYAVGSRIANEDDWPEWNRGNEFRATREASDDAR
ncbi:MAG TPA: M28 family metallopeptidase [Steroidobacteraceae bacterium]|nr:M28 family metallopeptidase [Steroidobacteraceae bacterium]